MADLPADQCRLQIPYHTFLEEAALFMTWKQAHPDCLLGVLVEPGQTIEQLAPYLSDLALISLSFPVFRDGRHFFSAGLLREKYQYNREIRAIGNLTEDQLSLLARCGCDAFILPVIKAKLWWQHAQSHITIAYQPTGKRCRGNPAGQRRHHLTNQET